MNWKNVVRLISVDVKSGRLIRGQRFRRYRESKLFQYVLYGGACVLGLAIGLGVGTFYNGVTDPEMRTLFHQGALNFFLSLPTLVLVYSLVFTMMAQMRRIGVKASIQPPYWLPITWEEHTLASTLANLMGFSLASIILIGSCIAVASIFLDEVPLAVFAIFTLLASAFLASITTEIFRILQVRFIGAVYKSSGRAAVWVRFLGSILFLVVFYVVWFSITSGYGSLALVEMVASAQRAAWFIPYVWLGMALASFVSGLLAHTVIFSLASLFFILILFYVAVKLNSMFGLYEPPAITVLRGAYAPKVGFLGKLGFSPLEAAVIRKDFKAFTRRRELMYIFIMPIVFIIMPLMQFSGAMGRPVPPEPSTFLFAWVLLTPGAIMAVMLGLIMVGEEGGSVWLFFSSPITARSLVKCKYAFVTIFSCVVMLVCGVVGILVARPSPSIAAASLTESIFLIFALGAVSLRAGVRGAEFVEVPRPRMIRPMTALVNVIVCLVLASAILSPLVPYAVATMGLPLPLPKIDLHVALLASGVIASAVTYVFYGMAVKSAEELLAKAEA
ncbi:MAG: ABC-2 transporter permease [Candidatus Bathyarchaeia archaeon]